MGKRGCHTSQVLSISLLPLLGACAGAGRHVSDWGEITLAPGDTGTCLSNPCRVFFQMPPGEGTYRVTANSEVSATPKITISRNEELTRLAHIC